MARTSPQLWKAGTALCLTVFLIACAPPRGQSGKNSENSEVAEAYRLMDKGANAKAFIILEERLANHPDDIEARLLLASSLAGQVGIDLYKVHEHFSDLFLKKSLGDTLLDKTPGGKSSASIVKQRTDEEILNELKEIKKTSADLFVYRVDLALLKIRRGFEIFNRLMTIGLENWPLMHQAIEILSVPEFAAHRDVAAYRLFLRIIYIKSLLDTKIIVPMTDSSEAQPKWICSLQSSQIVESLQTIVGELDKAVMDYQMVKPGDTGEALSKMSVWLSEFMNLIAALSAPIPKQELPTGDSRLSYNPTSGLAETAFGLMRNKLQCGK